MHILFLMLIGLLGAISMVFAELSEGSVTSSVKSISTRTVPPYTPFTGPITSHVTIDGGNGDIFGNFFSKLPSANNNPAIPNLATFDALTMVTTIRTIRVVTVTEQANVPTVASASITTSDIATDFASCTIEAKTTRKGDYLTIVNETDCSDMPTLTLSAPTDIEGPKTTNMTTSTTDVAKTTDPTSSSSKDKPTLIVTSFTTAAPSKPRSSTNGDWATVSMPSEINAAQPTLSPPESHGIFMSLLIALAWAAHAF